MISMVLSKYRLRPKRRIVLERRLCQVSTSSHWVISTRLDFSDCSARARMEPPCSPMISSVVVMDSWRFRAFARRAVLHSSTMLAGQRATVSTHGISSTPPQCAVTRMQPFPFASALSSRCPPSIRTWCRTYRSMASVFMKAEHIFSK